MQDWLAQRTRAFDVSGIRKFFDLGAKMRDPINLSIGQPDFDVPEEVKQAAITAIREGRNGYALSQGMPVLRDKLQARVESRFGHADREVFVTCGTSGGLVLAMMALVDPGDEVILPDPCFGMYNALAAMMGGRVVSIDTYPDFHLDPQRVAEAITPRTKLILVNSPNNPTGAVATREELRAIAELAAERNVALLSDEIYHDFCYDEPCVSPAEFNPQTIVVDGFSKSHGMPGWRLGFAHGPAAVIHEMIKIQQYSFVCAPQPVQWAGAAAMEVDISGHIDAYRRKRDMIVEGLRDHYELICPRGAFYAFPKAPWGSGTEFCMQALEGHKLLVVPGGNFSRQDSHFRISYAASDPVLHRGIKALVELARKE
ncbi:MAG: pyridoxal phosphate-dependent aminotransferase [Thermoguttaceae bacterium]|jgi:aspartate aminotransferase/aminotransferase|nr:pyridoxal phosphate-dependent aminotransferase [Thermoguttaceae bacterium]